MAEPREMHPEGLLLKLKHLRSDLIQLENDLGGSLGQISPSYTLSALNLLHYIALRRNDLREIQESLTALGLSSLGRSEGSVLANLDKVLLHLSRMVGDKNEEFSGSHLSNAQARALLDEHTRELLGSPRGDRLVRIMVTMPGEAATDYNLIRDLLAQGMDCMRINCAHDDQEIWGKMIEHLKKAREELGLECRILMDLAGPKLRTGPMGEGPRVVKFRPHRNELGRVTAPARVWLWASEHPKPPRLKADESAPDAQIPVPLDWLKKIRRGDRIEFRDSRRKKRSLKVSRVTVQGVWAESNSTCYLTTGTKLHLLHKKPESRKESKHLGLVGELPEKPVRIHLNKGDILVMRKDILPGTAAKVDPDTGKKLPARISCTLPQIFEDVQEGESIWFDDGKIGGVIHKVHAETIDIEITQTSPGGDELGADKGINLPDTHIRLPALTEKDIEDLRFVASHADLVGYSFVNDAEDVRSLQKHLGECGGSHLGIVLKIETKRAFEHLPLLILTAMRSKHLGVMIARGDLAVECGFERLAEVQEEILWVCEAAHVPVIWATQVLENLAKTGRPSRAEITDAAMGERAECVMLNKGPHIREAVQLLANILMRMQAHQFKKRAQLRRLNVADLFSLATKQAQDLQTVLEEPPQTVK
ncbi:hypothetical protein KIH39_19510 [Telmatocola sphagniphila]|uniref:pyruvate kinase n=1 Tax=Telmatocola sphagniphila TaxID=1123043 RepID=A0A8E6B2P4_9BACT|nr:pyruvate kinase [Telmatocola sphagniphila]QVL31020.1 hypothetical protein KIH39_19510 [Telmatocola sphagniphila]